MCVGAAVLLTTALSAAQAAQTAQDLTGKWTMKGTLKTDGTLSGFMSSAMGDMTWSASRDKSK